MDARREMQHMEERDGCRWSSNTHDDTHIGLIAHVPVLVFSCILEYRFTVHYSKHGSICHVFIVSTLVCLLWFILMGIFCILYVCTVSLSVMKGSFQEKVSLLLSLLLSCKEIGTVYLRRQTVRMSVVQLQVLKQRHSSRWTPVFCHFYSGQKVISALRTKIGQCTLIK